MGKYVADIGHDNIVLVFSEDAPEVKNTDMSHVKNTGVKKSSPVEKSSHVEKSSPVANSSHLKKPGSEHVQDGAEKVRMETGVTFINWGLKFPIFLERESFE